jgi:transposase
VETHPPLAQKKRDITAFCRAQSELEELKAQAQRGELTLAFADEAGFTQTQPNRNAWTPAGQCHATTAVRGKRLNIIGALLSTGGLFTAKLWQNTTAELFAGFLGLLLEHVGKPLTVVLDNASVHTAKAVKPMMDLLKKKGLTLYFLPPYSPELNRIEILWRKVKHEWMAFKTRDAKTLEADLDEIFQKFGEHYKLTF